MAARVLVGTSGWSYAHWAGRFYPEDLPRSRWLPYYAARFPAVEINNTYYRFPSERAVEGWARAVPDGFRFVVKAHRRVTHRRRLEGADDTVRDLDARLDLLGDKRAAVLFQLPPTFREDAARLRAFLARLPPGRRHVAEFRHPSWYVDDVRDALSEHGVAFCVHDFPGARSPEWVTADFAYVRFHGPERAYAGRYGRERVAAWAERVRAWRDAGLDVLCFFNNDEAAHATRDAADLLARVSDGVPEPAEPRELLRG